MGSCRLLVIPGDARSDCHRAGDLESNPASRLDLLSDGVMTTRRLTALLHSALAAWSCELFHARAGTPENWSSGGNTRMVRTLQRAGRDDRQGFIYK